MRLKQEIVLGIGGWRLLDALGIKPDVCHLNEGHAAFALLERARSFMRESGQPFAVALAATRAGNLFTTHTAVAAGFDLFSPRLHASSISAGTPRRSCGLSHARAAGSGAPESGRPGGAVQHGLSWRSAGAAPSTGSADSTAG